MKIIYTFIFCFLCFFCTAQQPNNNAGVLGNLQGLRIAYITKQLNLNTDEAQKFWPVYFSFTDEIRNVRQKNKDNAIALDEATLNVKKKFLPDFKKILGTDERANKVFFIDRDFAAEVKKELDKRRELKKQLNR
jgi:hypothetical protein